MNTNGSYALQPNYGILSHWGNPLAVGDYDDNYISVDAEKLDVQIRSGDYFVTLATTIEVLSQRLAIDKNPAANDFERIANELLYLQNYYKVVKKSDPES